MNATNKIPQSNKLQVEGVYRVAGKILGILWPLMMQRKVKYFWTMQKDKR